MGTLIFVHLSHNALDSGETVKKSREMLVGQLQRSMSVFATDKICLDTPSIDFTYGSAAPAFMCTLYINGIFGERSNGINNIIYNKTIHEKRQ